MKVRAIQNGYHGKYRYAGDEFTIPSEKHFSARWMVKLDEPSKKGPARPSKPESKPEPPKEAPKSA